MEDLVKILITDTAILNNSTISPEVTQSLGGLGKVVQWGVVAKHPTPCFSAALNYLYATTDAQSTANIIQAQRDFFGAHRYQRIDDDSNETYHTSW